MFEDLGGILYLDKKLIFEIMLQLLNAVVMAFILAKLVYIPVKEFLAKRAERVENTLKNAEKNLNYANNLKSEYEDKVRNIEQESADILEKARKKGKEREEQIVNEARDEASTTKYRALLDIEREKIKVKDDIKNQIISISSLMANKFMESEISESTQEKLLDQAIDELGDVKWLK